MASCPKCGTIKIKRKKLIPLACKHCGPLRGL